MAPHIVANPFIHQCNIKALMMMSVKCEIPPVFLSSSSTEPLRFPPRRRFKAPWTWRDFLLFVVHQLNSLLCWQDITKSETLSKSNSSIKHFCFFSTPCFSFRDKEGIVASLSISGSHFIYWTESGQNVLIRGRSPSPHLPRRPVSQAKRTQTE